MGESEGMSEWIVKCYVWPYFPKSDNQSLVGDEIQEFQISANDFDDAVKQGKSIISGIYSNPNVWQTGIKGVWEKP